MGISKEALLQIEAPFTVVCDLHKKQRPIQVVGFKQNDPLGVGGGLFPDIPVVVFEGGGWLQVQDLMKHYTLLSKEEKL